MLYLEKGNGVRTEYAYSTEQRRQAQKMMWHSFSLHIIFDVLGLYLLAFRFKAAVPRRGLFCNFRLTEIVSRWESPSRTSPDHGALTITLQITSCIVCT